MFIIVKDEQLESMLFESAADNSFINEIRIKFRKLANDL